MSRRSAEVVIYGFNAVMAAFRHRPGAIRRVFHTRERRLDVASLLKATAAAHRPYREVDADEMQRIARTVHHEGVAVVVDPLPLVPLPDLLTRAGAGGVLLALDAVGNPHNLGAILRSAAWFGVSGVLFPVEPRQATLGPSAIRVAQGGAEVVPCCGVRDLPAALDAVGRAGVSRVAVDQRARTAIFGATLKRPLCLVLGNETDGLDAAVRSRCDDGVAVPGSGAVESLNVSVAAGIVLAAVYAAGEGA